MIPIPFDHANHIFKAPEGHEYKKLDVPCFIGSDAIAVCFSVSDEEIEELKTTNRIWVIVKGLVFPPMSLQVNNPITTAGEMDFPEFIEDEI